MGKKIDLTGQRFGRLVVVEEIGVDKYKNISWLCECDCGNFKEISSPDLRSGKTQSCGCLRNEIVKKRGEEIEGKKVSNWLKEHDNKEGTRLSTLTQKKNSKNTSGFKGVYWHKRLKKWQGRIQFKGESIHLGYFDNKQDAINARKEAEEKYFQPILDKYGKESN